MNEVKIFQNDQFGQVRTIDEDGKVLFCGSDVAKALGYERPNDAVMGHCRYTVKRSIPHPQNPAKEIGMTFIPEGDMYRLITRSHLPEAERFESWVFDEVIPSIRKHGVYATKEILNDPDALATSLSEIKAKYELLDEENTKLAVYLSESLGREEHLTRQLNVYREAVDATGLYNIRMTAQSLGLCERDFINRCIKRHYLYRGKGNRLCAYAKHIQSGLWIVRGGQPYTDARGRERLRGKLWL